jgi:hypothetical protein
MPQCAEYCKREIDFALADDEPGFFQQALNSPALFRSAVEAARTSVSQSLGDEGLQVSDGQAPASRPALISSHRTHAI